MACPRVGTLSGMASVRFLFARLSVRSAPSSYLVSSRSAGSSGSFASEDLEAFDSGGDGGHEGGPLHHGILRAQMRILDVARPRLPRLVKRLDAPALRVRFDDPIGVLGGADLVVGQQAPHDRLLATRSRPFFPCLDDGDVEGLGLASLSVA